MSDWLRPADVASWPAHLIWDVRRTLGMHGETAMRLAYHAALPVVVDSGLLNLLRVNFFLDPPDDLPYEVEAELLMSPLFREVSEGLYEIEPELRTLLLTGLYSPPYGPDRTRRVAALLEQYTDATAAWRSLPSLEAAQRLTAVSFLNPELAKRWLEDNEAGLGTEDASSVSASAGLRREWYVAMRRRADERASVADVDTEVAQARVLLDSASADERLAGLRALGTLALLPGASSDRIASRLCQFVEVRGASTRSADDRDRSDLQEALALLGTLPSRGIRLEDTTIRGVSLAGLDFSMSRFDRVTLTDVNATGVNFTGAHLENCTLINVLLDDAMLDNAYCHFASMSRASLQRVSITGARIMAEQTAEVTASDTSGAPWQVTLAGRQTEQEASIQPGESDARSSGQSASHYPRIWGDVPLRSKHFTGRDDILDRLRPNSAIADAGSEPAPPLPRALTGMSGVGKTAVAIEYAHRYSEDYDAVWWIPSDQPALVREALATLADRLNLDPPAEPGIDVAASAVLDSLRRGEPYRRWLLIFDNANQPEEFGNLIPAGPGDVLITSRNHRWQSLVDTVPVDVFTRQESVQFLTKTIPELTPLDANLLAVTLGDLPLALAQAVGLISETGMHAEEYLRLLDEEVTRLLAEGKPLEYPTSMTAGWKLASAAIRQQRPSAFELLRLLAFFGPEPIPAGVLRQGRKHAATGVGEVLGDPIELSSAMSLLMRFALIQREGRSVSVHRLVAALTRDELNADEQSRYRHDVHLMLAAAAPSNPADWYGWSDFADLIPHLTAPNVLLAGCRDETVRAFALNAMRYLLDSGEPATCRALAEMCIPQWTADSGPDSADVIQAQSHLDDASRQLEQ